jgi:mRNA interferase MazF
VNRGDAVWLPPDRRARGHEQQGARLGVVLQSDAVAALSTVVVALTSASAGPSSFRPEIEVAGRRTRVLVDQLRAVDRARIGRRAGRLTWPELSEVQDALRLVLGL